MITTLALRMFFLLCLVLSCLPLSAQAADKVVVIPLFGHGKPLKNIITVAKANGMFTDPVAAVNSITDASADNPYLVVIGPGVYTLTHTLVMKPWVDITGSGENVTRLVGAISGGDFSSSAIVQMKNDMVLSSLTVENKGGDSYSVGIYSGNSSILETGKLWHLNVKASGGTINDGIMIYYSSAKIIETAAYGQGGKDNSGIAILHSFATLEGVKAIATGDSSSKNYGVISGYSHAEMKDVCATASGGMTNAGIQNYFTTVHMTQVEATGTGGTNNYGIYTLISGNFITTRSSRISGESYGIYNEDLNFGPDKTFISQSTISGGIYVAGTTTIKCVACDDGAGNALNNNCL